MVDRIIRATKHSSRHTRSINEYSLTNKRLTKLRKRVALKLTVTRSWLFGKFRINFINAQLIIQASGLWFRAELLLFHRIVRKTPPLRFAMKRLDKIHLDRISS